MYAIHRWFTWSLAHSIIYWPFFFLLLFPSHSSRHATLHSQESVPIKGGHLQAISLWTCNWSARLQIVVVASRSMPVWRFWEQGKMQRFLIERANMMKKCRRPLEFWEFWSRLTPHDSVLKQTRYSNYYELYKLRT